MTPQEALMRVIDHHEILHDEMRSLMDQIIEGKISPELTSAIIVGLRVKRETIGEIVAASQVMRNLATKVDLTNPQNLVDTCGTGGDTAHTFNISTPEAIFPRPPPSFPPPSPPHLPRPPEHPFHHPRPPELP